MYYLNAFNEMLRKRERQNMMGGGGNDYGVGTTAPSGPMGLGPAQDRSGLRDFYNNLSPAANFALGMAPVIGPAFNLGKLANYGISAYDKSQLAPADAAMASARQGFQASEKSGYATPDYGYVDDSGDRLGFSGPTVGAPMEQSSVTGTDLGPLSGGLQGGGISNQTGMYGDASAGVDIGAAPEGNNAGLGANSEAFAKGGMVHAKHLKGRAPAPDDGYGALQGGEYVITKAAVEKYGKRLLDAINNGTFR